VFTTKHSMLMVDAGKPAINLASAYIHLVRVPKRNTGPQRSSICHHQYFTYVDTMRTHMTRCSALLNVVSLNMWSEECMWTMDAKLTPLQHQSSRPRNYHSSHVNHTRGQLGRYGQAATEILQLRSFQCRASPFFNTDLRPQPRSPTFQSSICFCLFGCKHCIPACIAS